MRLLALAVCLVLASCGGSSPSATALATTNKAATVASSTAIANTASNVASILFGNLPQSTSSGMNRPYVSVTICIPGTSTCQTIDHILLDTGSSGLRIYASSIADSTFVLPAVNNTAGLPVGECLSFVSGYTWGSVRSADVRIAGESASKQSIQMVGDTQAAYARVPSSCRNSGQNLGTVAVLGQNGILGVGLFSHDCGASCVTSTDTGVYFGCATSGSCTASTLALTSQVSNPVAAFALDNNGVVIVLPSVATGGATTLAGSLIFGIGTASNNPITSERVYQTDSSGNFISTYKGVSYASSYLDTGSSGYYLPDSSIATSSRNSDIFSPSPALALTASNSAADGSASATVNFTLDSYDALASNTVAASIGFNNSSSSGNTSIAWGLPFFFGRSVFVAISGASTPQGAGPFWAY